MPSILIDPVILHEFDEPDDELLDDEEEELLDEDELDDELEDWLIQPNAALLLFQLYPHLVTSNVRTMKVKDCVSDVLYVAWLFLVIANVEATPVPLTST